MRKTIIILLFMVLASGLYAAPVSQEKALKVAQKVFASQPYTKASGGELRIIWDGEFEKTKANTDPDFYVVARDGGGFVIVAGDDNVRPVLGFSMESSFSIENMPANVKAWMERIKLYCRSDKRLTENAARLWADYSTKTDAIQNITDEFLESRTVEWNQDGPANLKCPIVTGQRHRAVCGCVPLAFAEVMVWFGYPTQGHGYVEGYTYTTSQDSEYSIPGHELDTQYDMQGFQSLNTPELFYANTNTELGENVGQFVYDIATVLKTGFNEDGSGAYEDVFSIDEHLGYNRSAIARYPNQYPKSEWDDMLKNEIKLHPVYTGGFSSSDGHAYVADGFANYNGETVFHYNLGWGGSCNGYYFSDYQVDFQNDIAIFDFVPDPDNKTEYQTLLGLSNWGEDGGGLILNNAPVEPGKSIEIDLIGVLNRGFKPYWGMLRAYRVNKNGEKDGNALSEDQFGSEDDPILSGWSYAWTWGFNAPEDLSFGDRFVFFYEKPDGVFVPLEEEEPESYFDEIAVFPAALIKTEKSYKVGDTFHFRLTNHDYTYKSAVWHITDPSGKQVSYPQTDKGIRLKSSGKYTIKVITSMETIVTTITVN